MEAIATAEAALWVFGAGVLRARLERRVSWTPGAEGAPREGFVVEVCAVEGTIRRDWGFVSGANEACDYDDDDDNEGFGAYHNCVCDVSILRFCGRIVVDEGVFLSLV